VIPEIKEETATMTQEFREQKEVDQDRIREIERQREEQQRREEQWRKEQEERKRGS